MENNITVIIPVHKYNEDIKVLLNKAISSVKEQNVNISVVAPKEVIDSANLDVNCIENTGNTDFASQIYLGAENCTTEYFAILEFDDTYEQYFFKDLQKFISDGNFNKSDIILPIVALHKGDNKSLAFANDACWSQDFSEERGFLGLESTSMYDIFLISGAVIKKDVFLELGGIKMDNKIYFSKEFFMRALVNDKKVSVYPKIGYKHYVGRLDSLFDNMFKSGITTHERDFYNRKAIDEYKLNPKSEDYVGIVYTPPINNQ